MPDYYYNILYTIVYRILILTYLSRYCLWVGFERIRAVACSCASSLVAHSSLILRGAISFFGSLRAFFASSFCFIKANYGSMCLTDGCIIWLRLCMPMLASNQDQHRHNHIISLTFLECYVFFPFVGSFVHSLIRSFHAERLFAFFRCCCLVRIQFDCCDMILVPLQSEIAKCTSLYRTFLIFGVYKMLYID